MRKLKHTEKTFLLFFDPLKSSLEENQDTSVSGAQILNNPWG